MSIVLDGTSGITSPGGDTATVSVATPIVKSPSSLSLQTNGSTTAVTIDTAGQVGIGTSSPSYKLSIAGGSATSSNLLLTHNTDATGAYSRIKFAFAEGNTSISSEIRNIQYTAGANGASLAFFY